ncbi:MAPEG family protein [Pseudohalocynthiibacter aestuariivivens]|nr:MAPEG family protein [Pseudohalocynthiibacter aestuariivivens]QIE44127.1 MAPEG family protein [Pseudohalocynthiibacter aestuariivivens]
MHDFAQYGHAIIAMALMGLTTLVLSPLSAMRKTAAGLVPGATPPEDYASATYRWHRAYGNAAESVGTFALVTLAAILAGAAPFWVNLFASTFFVARIVMLVIHLRGGKADMGARSFAYVLGWLMCILLAILAILAVFGGPA